ncbi:MAG: DUF4062 domain-containing protein [Phycisphaerae bacterium]
MIPNVFVSSTIEDLQHLREAVRDVISELGYTPIMSEYADFGYLPNASAQEACYIGVSGCQMAIVIIGKRYGASTNTGVSVTQNEYRKAKELNIPVFCVIDQEVLAFKKVYDLQPTDRKPTLPTMDEPAKTFAFMEEITSSPVNNGFLAFSGVAEVRDKIKGQMAHLFGDMLGSKFNPLKSGIADVLSEVKTLRHELGEERTGKSSTEFLRAIRFLLDDENKNYKDLLEFLYDTADAGVPDLVASKTFEEFIGKAGSRVEIVEETFDSERTLSPEDHKDTFERGAISSHYFMYGPGQKAYFAFFKDRHIEMNTLAQAHFEDLHKRLRKSL